MEKNTFLDIRSRILNLFSENGEFKEYIDIIEITKNDDTILVLDFDFKNCISQLVVTLPLYAPFRNVSFEAMSLDSKKPKLVYFFYDIPEISVDNIVNQITYAVKFCDTYSDGLLESTYLGKKGFIELNLKELNLGRKVHPSDWGKVNEGILNNEFICIGIEFQFIVVTFDDITLRVTPDIFKVVE